MRTTPRPGTRSGAFFGNAPPARAAMRRGGISSAFSSMFV
nr:hypothetical protein RVX_1853 [Nitratidesulfovibrio sp. HK-II]